MDNISKTERYSVCLSIIVWGALWGVFEATVGYLLHSISFGYPWIIWYPVACFFMTNVYRRTRRASSIVLVGLLCASIKMLNLFLPGRIDQVINPAISIVFEAVALSAVVYTANRLFGEIHKNLFQKALSAFSMNTFWRLLYVLYLLFLVPDWIRDLSVISSAEKFIPFFVTQNLITSVLIFLGYQFKSSILKPIEIVETRISDLRNTVKGQTMRALQNGLVALLLGASIALQLMLK